MNPTKADCYAVKYIFILMIYVYVYIVQKWYLEKNYI